MKIEKESLEHCHLCPRECSVKRSKGEKGVCGQTSRIKVARADLHMWEEPCISGSRGSGAVFFCGCPLHCVFCQNHNIADGTAGKIISTERLAQIFMELQCKGANNINLVTAGQFVPEVIKALDCAKQQGLRIPIVYNTSAYENVSTIKMLEGYVDVYLPDLKYVDSDLSGRYSHAPDYFQVASQAIEEMVRQTGRTLFTDEKTQQEELDAEAYQKRSEAGEHLLMKQGVIVRHLLLPGCAEDSKRVLDYLLEKYGEQIFISIMNQYTPLSHAASYPELNRRVAEPEYEHVVEYAIEKGIENGFIQEGETSEESFIPEFDGKGV